VLLLPIMVASATSTAITLAAAFAAAALLDLAVAAAEAVAANGFTVTATAATGYCWVLCCSQALTKDIDDVLRLCIPMCKNVTSSTLDLRSKLDADVSLQILFMCMWMCSTIPWKQTPSRGSAD